MFTNRQLQRFFYDLFEKDPISTGKKLFNYSKRVLEDPVFKF